MFYTTKELIIDLENNLKNTHENMPNFSLYQWSFTFPDKIMRTSITVKPRTESVLMPMPFATASGLFADLKRVIGQMDKSNLDERKSRILAALQKAETKSVYALPYSEAVTISGRTHTIDGYVERHGETLCFNGKGQRGLNEWETVMLHTFKGSAPWTLGIITGRCEVHFRPSSSVAMLCRLDEGIEEAPYFGDPAGAGMPTEAMRLMNKLKVMGSIVQPGGINILQYDPTDLEACYKIG